jgi:DNA-binding transcriptional MerR regulator
MSEPKHQDALRTIGEVADDIGVAPHVLRFWESKFTQISPQKRRGRRYYSPNDIATILIIKELLYDQGYTIKGVHKHLKDIKASSSINVTSDGEKTSPEFTDAIKQLRDIHNELVSMRDKISVN